MEGALTLSQATTPSNLQDDHCPESQCFLFKSPSRLTNLTSLLICPHFLSIPKHINPQLYPMTFMVTYEQILFILSPDCNLTMSQRGCFPWGLLKWRLFFLPQPLNPWVEDFWPRPTYHCQDIACLPPLVCSSEAHNTLLCHQPLADVIYWPWSHFPSFGKDWHLERCISL